MRPLCDVGRGEALRWLCGCIGYSVEGARAIMRVDKSIIIAFGGLSEGIVVTRDVIPWGHVVPA